MATFDHYILACAARSMTAIVAAVAFDQRDAQAVLSLALVRLENADIGIAIAMLGTLTLWPGTPKDIRRRLLRRGGIDIRRHNSALIIPQNSRCVSGVPP